MVFCKRPPEGIQYIKVLLPMLRLNIHISRSLPSGGIPQAEEEMSKTAREVELRLHSSGEATGWHFGDGGYPLVI
jgi:hypothetical protein